MSIAEKSFFSKIFYRQKEQLMKPVRVRRQSGLDVYGVVASSLDDVVNKGCKKLGINKKRNFKRVVCEGAIVEDNEYFMSLEKNTVLVFETRDDKASPVDMLRQVLEAIRMNGLTANSLMEAVRDTCMTDAKLKQLCLALATELDGDIEAETKEEHPEWFQTVSNNSLKTKSSVMEDSAKGRVTSYFYAAKDAMKAADFTAPQKAYAAELQRRWSQRLKAERFYKHYFSRVDDHPDRFCDSDGEFLCQGDYQSAECRMCHSINPYNSHQHRVLFSTWNLDHQIEKSRTVLPRMVELIKLRPLERENINWDYFYELLFTRSNIKLVHIGCHVKQEHTEAVIDESRVTSSL